MTKLCTLADVAYCLYPMMPLKWMCALARISGTMQYYCNFRNRRIVSGNLNANFKETHNGEELRVMARKFFEYAQQRGLLWALSSRMSLQKLPEILPVSGMEHLDWAIARGKGTILLGSHLNSICMFVCVDMLRRQGYDVRVAVPSPDDPWAPSLFRRFINRNNNKPTAHEILGAFHCQFNIRPIVKALRENAIVGQTGDGLHSAKFANVQFMGRSLPFTTGMMKVAQMSNAVVVPMFVTGTPPNKLKCVFEEPVLVKAGENADESLKEAVAAYVKRLEYHMLLDIPCWQHWLMEEVLDTMAAWPKQSLEARYRV